MKSMVSRSGDLFRDGSSGGWSHSEIIADGVTGDPVKIDPTGRGNTNGTVAIVCGTNTGNVQITIDDYAAIDDDSAVWIDWDKGALTGTTLDVFSGAITGIRGVSVSGPITFKLLI